MDELKNIAPETSKIKKESPFKVPENYFDDFSARLQSRLQPETETLPQKRRSIVRYLKPAMGLAASFLLIFMLVYWPISSFLPQYQARTYSIIEPAIEEDHFLPSLGEIDENSFFGLVIDAVNGELENEHELSDEELLSYLSANISDYEIYLHTEN